MEKKSKYNEDVEIDINACSATDFTGLIPSLPQSDAERESYEDLRHNYKNSTEDSNGEGESQVK